MRSSVQYASLQFLFQIYFFRSDWDFDKKNTLGFWSGLFYLNSALNSAIFIFWNSDNLVPYVQMALNCLGIFVKAKSVNVRWFGFLYKIVFLLNFSRS